MNLSHVYPAYLQELALPFLNDELILLQHDVPFHNDIWLHVVDVELIH